MKRSIWVLGLTVLIYAVPSLAATLLLLSMAVWRTPIVALMPDITPSKYRSQANGVINFMGGIGAIIAFLGGATLYEMNPNYPFLLGAGLVAVSAIMVFIFIKEPKEYTESSKETPDLKDSIQMILQDKDKSTVRILLAIFFWFIAYNGIEAFFTLYGKNHLGIPAACSPAQPDDCCICFRPGMCIF